jgi:hypothetical protein
MAKGSSILADYTRVILFECRLIRFGYLVGTGSDEMAAYPVCLPAKLDFATTSPVPVLG